MNIYQNIGISSLPVLLEAVKHIWLVPLAWRPSTYVRLPDLLLDLELAMNSGSYKKVMAKYANPLLLIIDEWLLLKPTENEAQGHLRITASPQEEIFHSLLFPIQRRRLV